MGNCTCSAHARILAKIISIFQKSSGKIQIKKGVQLHRENVWTNDWERSFNHCKAKAEAGIPMEDEESWALWKDYTTKGLTEAVMEKMARSFALYLRCKLKVKDTTL